MIGYRHIETMGRDGVYRDPSHFMGLREIKLQNLFLHPLSPVLLVLPYERSAGEGVPSGPVSHGLKSLVVFLLFKSPVFVRSYFLLG